jgi:hypothetical protein
MASLAHQRLSPNRAGPTVSCGSNRAPSTPRPTGSVARVLALQQALGNQAVQAKLGVSQPGDPLEQEADRVAEAVMRSPAPSLHSYMSTGGIPEAMVQRTCANCDEEKERVQLKAAPIGSSADVRETHLPPLADRGAPLPESERQFFEPRFGRDFSGVRIHTSGRAANSARAFNAVAYTTGTNVVFGPGHYAPGTAGGRQLLAHELVHVVQQTTGRGAPMIARRGPAPVPVPVRPPVRAPSPTTRRPEGQRYAPYPPTTLPGLLEQGRQRAEREQNILEAERPVATLDRGGRAPDFITEAGEQLGMWAWGSARYRVRRFHVLDAIEYEVSRAATEADLNRILMDYISFPPIVIGRWSIRPTFRLFVPVFPDNLDPDGSIRLETYEQALAQRIADVPALSRTRAVTARIPREARRRGCTVRPARPMGDNLDPLAPIYCQVMTGTIFEYRVTAPNGDWVQYDALVGETAIECKCGYAWLSRDLNSDEAWRRNRAERRLQARDEQMLRQRRVAAACGLNLVYYVSNREFADLLADRWMGDPLVEWRPWSECD